MRIIRGRWGGIRLNPPGNLPVRPTTDLAKEALFNILLGYLELEAAECLDLCCGTGSISFELASRGTLSVDAVDLNAKCLHYVNEVCKKYKMENITTRRAEALKYIASCKKKYDFIFTDPPYDIASLPQLPQRIFEKGMLTEGGLLVVEHPTTRKMAEHPNFVEVRKYGYSSFSFYKN
ncbi:MAG TPA: 16S rRNA (guanine(966)-N(2))-methyltransferase RsmD [Sphingobacterium sp.]|nr:16S rRNA (guanine(966)-N(2))-methyltransferase RsmD [Sphingobacterium sp.]